MHTALKCHPVWRNAWRKMWPFMSAWNTYTHPPAIKCASMLVKENNRSYTFNTPHDTGTATAYKAMILYDLAILNSTSLPAVIHDSLLFDDLGHGLVEGIMRLYEQSTKQIFISFDKQDAQTATAQRILQQHAVLRLADDVNALYGTAWNRKEE